VETGARAASDSYQDCGERRKLADQWNRSVRFLLVALLVALTSAFMAPVMPSKLQSSKVIMGEGGKGFGGGEATRDPEPTEVDPNDPKGKQQAIHKAESFAEYLAKRKAA